MFYNVGSNARPPSQHTVRRPATVGRFGPKHPAKVVGIAGHSAPTCSGPDGPPQTVLRRPFGRAADTTAAATPETISWDK